MTVKPPDIVLIHCHDLGRWLGAYGMASVPSRNIDSFAASAVVFDNAHAAAPLCSPARGALFTGIAPHRNGVQGLVHDSWRYREGVLTAPEHLRRLGYHSVLVGFQHEDVDPTVLGFDECVGLGYLPRVNQVVDSAVGWLSSAQGQSGRSPVFLTIGTWEVHRPWPDEDYTPADPDGVDVPPYLPDNVHTRRDIADFHGSIRQFDEGIGRLIDAIDHYLDPDNTLVILTTDHGAAFPRAKSTLYNAGTGVTLVMRPPARWGISPSRVEGVVSHMDILPTLVAIGGGAVSPELEGRSLLPYLLGDAAENTERVIFTAKSFHDTYDPKRAARSLDFAYIRNYEPGPQLQLASDLEGSHTRAGMGDAHLAARPLEELYDRRSDPEELHNVVGDARYQEVREHYARLLHEYLHATRDPIETTPLAPAPQRNRAAEALSPVPPPRWIQPD